MTKSTKKKGGESSNDRDSHKITLISDAKEEIKVRFVVLLLNVLF